MAWKKLLKTDYDAVIIFEDDAEMLDNFFEMFYKYIEELPEDWDIFSFFRYGEEWRYQAERDSNGLESLEYICRAFQSNCCAGYIINKSGAQKALEEIAKNQINAPVDWFVFDAYHKAFGWNKIFNSYTIKPGVDSIMKFAIDYEPDTSFINSTEDMKFRK